MIQSFVMWLVKPERWAKGQNFHRMTLWQCGKGKADVLDFRLEEYQQNQGENNIFSAADFGRADLACNRCINN